MHKPYNPTGKDTLAQVIAAHAQSNPEAVAFIAGDQTMTWQQYHDRSNTLAGVLIDYGFKQGDGIALLLPDSCETHVAYVACEKAGVVGMAIAARAGDKEIAHLINVSGSVALLCLSDKNDEAAIQQQFDQLQQHCPGLQSLILLGEGLQNNDISINGNKAKVVVNDKMLEQIELRRAGPDDLFLLNSTSGTTGMPKCVMQNQRRWFAYAALVHDSSACSADDIFLRAVPASVGFGLWTGHFIPTLLGTTTVVLPRFTVEAVLSAIETHKVSVLAAVSTQFIMLLNSPDLDKANLTSLRVMYTGGEAVPYDRAAKFEQTTGAAVLQFYGSNETGALSYTTLRDTQQQRLTTAGHIIPSMNVRLVNNNNEDITDSGRGQPVCNGPVTCMGYFNNDDANQKLYTPEGDMKMEDIVTIDNDGYLKVIGRVGDFIIRGGKNISAVAVEESVLPHPDIDMAAAVAMPDSVFGEKVCLYIVSTSNKPITVKELASFLEANGISKEYFPEKIISLDTLPTVSGGKVAKKVLREDIKKRLLEEKTSSDKGAVKA